LLTALGDENCQPSNNIDVSKVIVSVAHKEREREHPSNLMENWSDTILLEEIDAEQ
jgi:hypothetical protein